MIALTSFREVFSSLLAVTVACWLLFWPKQSRVQGLVAKSATTSPITIDQTATLLSPQQQHQRYLTEPRVQFFWASFLWIYLAFQSFSCGRADRLWRISNVYDAAPPVLLKPYGVSYLWYELLAPRMAMVENTVLVCMVMLAIPPRWCPSFLGHLRRWLALTCGLGWLYLHAYEHSLTAGSHTHLLPAVCMVALALPAEQSLQIIRQWNAFLLFSAGTCKLFNGNHHSWWAWMDGQSLQFYFSNTRQAVPEPLNTWTRDNAWFASAQSIGSVLFELSTPLLLVWRRYRIIFPFLGALFHGFIWYTLGINYLTSVVIQFTLVLDGKDWKCLLGRDVLHNHESFEQQQEGHLSKAEKKKKQDVSSTSAKTRERHSAAWARVVVFLNAILLITVVVLQVEFWPLSNIPMFSAYRPAAGYNTTHIANRTYLDHLINECAPHVWSRHWTDVMVTNRETGTRHQMVFCATSRVLPNRGIRDVCLIPTGNSFDSERYNPGERKSEAYRLEPPDGNPSVQRSMRPTGWSRQRPMVIMATLPGRYHVYCQNETLSPAQDWLYRNCAFLRSMGITKVGAELVVHLGTGDLVVDSVFCDDDDAVAYPADRVPTCIQKPFRISH